MSRLYKDYNLFLVPVCALFTQATSWMLDPAVCAGLPHLGAGGRGRGKEEGGWEGGGRGRKGRLCTCRCNSDELKDTTFKLSSQIPCLLHLQ